MNALFTRILSTGIVLGAFVTFLTPATAQADELSFSLPVNLAKLNSDITAGRVECSVSSAASYSSDLEVGHGYSTSFAIVAGAYDGVVVVDLTTAGDHGVEDVRSYACSVELHANGEWFDMTMNHPVYPMNSSLPHHTVAMGSIY